MSKERILYEDEDIIVCHKASGIATQTARVGQADMVSEVTNYLTRRAGSGNDRGKKTAGQPSHGGQGIPYVGVVHRLDQPVEGVLVFAKNKQAAAGLSRQIVENRMEKDYYAVVCGRRFDKGGELTDYMLKDAKTNMSRIVPAEVKGAKRAALTYEILGDAVVVAKAYTEQENDAEKEADETVPHQTVNAEECPLCTALARIRLHTGRHHQIRAQMSHAGMSLLGDYKYAGAEAAALSEKMHVKGVALCAYRLAFWHPVTGKKLQFEILPEGKIFQQYVGGQIV